MATSLEKAKRKFRRMQRKVEDICRQDPSLEASHVFHTLHLLEMSPLERLNRALLRAGKKTLHI